MTSLQRLKTTTLIVTPIQECKCGTRIDVSRYEPLQELTCPSCVKPFVVQGQLDRFLLVGIAGHGGTGTVYQAFDPQLGRQIALKVVRDDRATDEEVLAQLEAEAQITAALNHPHVLRVFSVGRAQGRFYIAMELVQGGSLDDLLGKHPALPEPQALEIAIQIAQGLRAAQAAGLVHRDVKPGNVLFSNAQTAKVMDFGLAIFERQAAAAAGGTVWGTPFYMSPERLEGAAEDFRSDLYSLGTVLFQMLTGRPPFDAGTPQDVAFKRLTHPAPSVLTYAPRVSNATAFVVKKMLERNRDERFQSYDELIQSLQYARTELGQTGKAQSRMVLDGSGQRRTGMWLTIGFAAMVLIALVVGVVMFKKARAKDEVSPIPVVATTVERPSAPATHKPAPPSPTVSKALKEAGLLPGIYRLTNRKTGANLDVASWNSNHDAPVHVWANASGFNAQWVLRPSGDALQLIAMHSCKALEVSGGSKQDNAAIRQGSVTGAEKQLWTLERTAGGYFKVIALCSGKALTVTDVNAKPGAPLGQRAIGDGEEQQWKLEPLGATPVELEPILTQSYLGDPPPPVSAKRSSAPTNGSRFVPINLASVMNCDSRGGTFQHATDIKATIRPLLTGWVDVSGVPFEVSDVTKAANGKDLLILKGGLGQAKEKYPKRVEVPVNGARLTKLHILGGVGGWGYPWNGTDKHVGVIAARVTVVRKGGAQQAILFRNGIDIADYNARHEIPGAAYVERFADYGRQVRFLSRQLFGSEPVEKLIIESFETNVAPAFVAITGEVAN